MDPNSKKYCLLLATFGETCKHYHKYPCIFVQFDEVKPFSNTEKLSQQEISSEAEKIKQSIKDSIAKAFKSHRSQIKFLEA